MMTRRRSVISCNHEGPSNTELSGEGPWPSALTSSAPILCWAAPLGLAVEPFHPCWLPRKPSLAVAKLRPLLSPLVGVDDCVMTLVAPCRHEGCAVLGAPRYCETLNGALARHMKNGAANYKGADQKKKTKSDAHRRSKVWAVRQDIERRGRFQNRHLHEVKRGNEKAAKDHCVIRTSQRRDASVPAQHCVERRGETPTIAREAGTPTRLVRSNALFCGVIGVPLRNLRQICRHAEQI